MKGSNVGRICLEIEITLRHSDTRQSALLSIIDEAIKRVHNAEELMLDGVITGDDYGRIKQDMELQINILGERVEMIRREELTVEKQTKQAMSELEYVPGLFEMMNTQLKRKLIRLLFPTPLVYM